MALAGVGSPPASAATLFWDINGAAPGIGGTGAWNTSNTFWNTSSTGSGGTPSVWNNGALDDAVFAGPTGAATVTLQAPITAHNLTFGAAPNYTLSGSTLTLGGGGTPTIDTQGSSHTINSIIAGTAGLAKSGTGTLVLNGANTYTGATSVGAGTLSIGNGGTTGSIANASVINAAGGATLQWNNANSTAQRTLTNTVTGAGTVRLQGQNATNALQTSVYVNQGNWSAFSGDLALNRAILWNNTAPSQLGTGTIRVQDRGTIAFNGNTFSNNLVVEAGAGWHHNVSGGDVVLGAIRLEGNNTLTGNIVLGGAPNPITLGDNTGANSTISSYGGGTQTLGGVISGPGGFAMSRYTGWNGGAGATVNIDLTGASSNTYSGTTIVDGQGGGVSLRLMKTGGAVAIAGNTTVQFGSATGGQANLRMGGHEQFGAGVVLNWVNAAGQWGRFDLQGTNQTIAGLTSTTTTASMVVQNQGLDGVDPGGNATLTLNGTGTYAAYGFVRDQDNGGITRKLNIVKNGTGTQTIGDQAAGAISFTGSTTVNGGILAHDTTLASANSWNSAVTVNAGGEFRTSGTRSNQSQAGATITLNGGILSHATTAANAWKVWSGQLGVGAAGGTINVNNTNTSNNNLFFDGGIAGSGTLALNTTGGGNNGIVFRTAVGSYSGALQAHSGNVFVNGTAGLVLQNSDVSLGAGATLRLNANWASTAANASVKSLSGAGNVVLGAQTITLGTNDGSGAHTGVISGTGALVKTGSDVQTLAGTNTYTGQTTINGGALRLAGGNALANTGAVVLANAAGAVLDLADSSETIGSLSGGGALGGNVSLGAGLLTTSANTSTTYAGVMGGSGGLVKQGTGTLTLTGDNTFTGAATIASGILQVGSGGTSGSLASSVVNNGRLTINRSDAVTLTGSISGTGSLVKQGAGAATLTGSNTYAGVTTISAGTLRAVGGNAVGDSSAVTLTNTAGAALDLSGSDETIGSLAGGGASGGNVTLGAGTLTAGGNNTTTTYNGVISGAGGLVKQGSGMLTLSRSNTFSGTTRIDAGTLRVAGGNALLNTGAVELANAAGATFDLNGTSETIGSLAGGGALGGNVTLGAGILTTGGANTDTTYGGVIGGTGGRLTKTGTGIFTLAGANTYTGTTTINAGGTLQLGAGGASGSVAGNVVDNGTLAFNRSDTATFAGLVSGSGVVAQIGPGTTVLSNANTYTGGTRITGAILQIAANNNLGNATGALTIDAGTLRSTADLASDRLTTLGSGGGTFDVAADTTMNQRAVISGAGALNKLGAGTLVLSGANVYGAGTTIGAGTLQIGNDNFTGSILGNVVNQGTLAFSRTNFYTFEGVVSGSGNLNKLAGGTLILTGDSSYSGGTTISAGTLALGNGGTSGAIVGDVSNSGALVFNRSDGLTLAGAIGGAGSLSQIGSGTTTLSGSSGTFSGATSVTSGTLRVNGVLGNAASTMTVSNGGTLGGTGTFGGSVSLGDGALAPGNSAGTLTIAGDLSLAAGSVLDYEFGQAGAVGGPLNDLTVVGGNLTLDGTLNVTATGGGATGPGLYRVISYGGALTNNGLAIGTRPPGNSLLVQTSVANQVNVINTAGLALNFWDGGTAPRNNGAINGGDGAWQASAGNDNWAEASGAINAPYTSGAFSVFSATPGTVTVDNSVGTVVSAGMQFATSGYVIQGQPITLAPGSNILRVGDGAGPGAGYVATIASELMGAGGIDKTDLGTLVLTGANSYTGGTTISGGTLQLGNGGSTGTIVGNVTNNGTLAFDRGDAVTFGAIVSGAGNVVKRGANALTLTGNNTYAGGTTIADGTLQIGNGGTSGAIAGDVVNNAALVINRADDIAFEGTISGMGNFTKLGGNTLTLTGDHTFTGNTTISAGTLQLGDGGTSGSISGDISNNATLAFHRSDAIAYAGVVSGAGALVQRGPGTTILTGNHLYTGGTTIAGGTLKLGDGGASGSVVGDVANQGALAFNRSDSVNFGGVVSGAGGVSQIGSGTTVLSAANSYGGGTTLSAGTVQVATDANLGAPSGAMTFNGGTLRTTASFTTARATSLHPAGGAIETQSGVLTHNGILEGAGALTKTGAGSLVLGADNTYTGGTTISSGTLQLGSGGTTGSIVGDVSNNASLVFNRSNAQTFGGAISGSGTVTKRGGGALTLTGASTYSGGTLLKGGQINVGHSTALGSGTLAMDEGTTLGFASHGLNLANAVVLTGTTDPVIDTGAFTETLSGVVSGGGALTKNGSGTLVLAGANTYTGATSVAAGALRAGAANAFSAASVHTVAAGATLDTGGFNQSVATLSNSGTVSLVGATGGSTLTVTGPYVGNAGILRLGTALGASASASDRLVLNGPSATASGTTSVQILNLGGLGALTTGDGIEVISARNGATTTAQTTRSAFALAGGGHVDAGAYEYRLHAADAQGAGENWYLRSTTTVVPPVTPPVEVPTYRAEVPLLAALPGQVRQADLAMLGNLHRRMGDEVPGTWGVGMATQAPSSLADAGTRRAWGRLVYADLDIAQPGVAQARTDLRVSGLQAGTDLLVMDGWRSGVYVGYLDGKAGVSGNARGVNADVGSNDLRSRFLGAYATWMDTSGWYVDTVLQGASHRYEIRPDGNPSVSGKASGLMASVEGGKAFAMTERWSIEPQAQLAWEHNSFDDLVLGGARVQQDSGNGWIARLGVRIKGDLATSAGRFQPYGRLNFYHANFGGDAALFIGPAASTVIASEGSYSAGEVAAGATLALTPAASLYGEIGTLWSIGGDASVKSSVQGTLGIKVCW